MSLPSLRTFRHPSSPRFFAMAGCFLAAAFALSPHAAFAADNTITPPAASQAVADAGADWLAAQLAGTGFLSSGGAPDYGGTADAILALHATGIGASEQTAAETYLKAHAVAGGYGGDGTAAGDDPGELATLILAAVDEGDNPSAYGGSLPIDDLVARLLATQGQHTSGGAQDAGLFGAADPTYDGAYREGLALAALKAANAPVNTLGVAWLTAQQCSDGGWEAYRSSETTPCSTADPSGGEDTNSTALAVEGLVAQGATPAASVLDYLHSAETSTGGFGYSAGSSSDPDSDGVVLQALIALGQDPSASTWAKGDHTPFTDLATFQLSCVANSGAFYYPAGAGQPETANLLATEQAVPGAAAMPFPIPADVVTPAPTTPASDCHTATPTPTVTASSSSASATPTSSVLGVTASKAPTLPFTGSADVTGLGALGLGLVAGGLVLLGLSRRRSGQHRS